MREEEAEYLRPQQQGNFRLQVDDFYPKLQSATDRRGIPQRSKLSCHKCVLSKCADPGPGLRLPVDDGSVNVLPWEQDCQVSCCTCPYLDTFLFTSLMLEVCFWYQTRNGGVYFHVQHALQSESHPKLHQQRFCRGRTWRQLPRRRPTLHEAISLRWERNVQSR